MKTSGTIQASYHRFRSLTIAALFTVAVAGVIFLSGSASAAHPQSAQASGLQGNTLLPSYTFCRTQLITIPWAGASTPYPSHITVARLQSSISNVSVTLNRLQHDWYDDIDMLLAGPEGQSVLLMSDTGDSCNRETTLTFNDRSPALPDFGCPFASDTYRPSNYESYPDNFPAPAPAPPYSDHLSAFNGTAPNGTWSLYVVDDYGIFTGRISGGWCLNIMVASSR
ncbi:MAG TPA: hypothetical protein VJ183_01380 [Chloroflexia bacterium]|nr:hypothetical protein [Chloroflexia bacterium]